MPESELRDRPREELSRRYHATIKVDGVEYVVGSVTSIDPKVHLRTEPSPVPQMMQERFLTVPDGSTGAYYQRQVEAGRVDFEGIAQMIADLLQSDRGRYLMEDLDITSLDLLTPGQAILLSTRIVTDFTKYSANEHAINKLWEQGEIDTFSPVEGDEMTPQEFLQASIKGMADPNWSGLGVCRNFASSVKAIFDSLKKIQQPENYLQNVYATFVEDDTGVVYDPIPEEGAINPPRRFGHVWNQFVTLVDGAVEVVQIDATWDQRDSATRKPLNEVNNLLRAEFGIRKLMNRLVDEIRDGNPDAAQQFRGGLTFYSNLVDLLVGTKGVDRNWKKYVMDQALSLLYFSVESKTFGPKTLATEVANYYLAAPAPSELAYLYQITEVVTELGREQELDNLYDAYIAAHVDKDWSNAFTAFSSDPAAQALPTVLLERLRAQYPDQYADHLANDGSFRSRMRLFRPEVELGEFAPWQNPSDLVELKHIIFEHEYNEPYIVRDIQAKLHAEETTAITEAEYRSIVTTLRDRLRAIDEQFYTDHIEALADYTVIHTVQRLKLGDPLPTL